MPSWFQRVFLDCTAEKSPQGSHTYGIDINPSSSTTKVAFRTTVLRWRKAKVVLGYPVTTLWNHRNPAGTVKPLINSAGIFLDIFFHHSIFYASMSPARFEPQRKRYVASRQTKKNKNKKQTVLPTELSGCPYQNASLEDVWFDVDSIKLISWCQTNANEFTTLKCKENVFSTLSWDC